VTPAAVAYCEGVTRTRARNFWYGIRLLPRPKREALAAVYALARRIDDVGDDDLPEAEKRRGLDAVERSLGEVGPDSPDPVLAALGLAGRRFDLPVQAFRDLIDGVRMDLDGTRYGTFEELVVYCRRVAGSVGRLSLSVFGAPDMAAAEPLADDLGVAMQLANVLRDVREDLGRGRVYLPAADLERFGCTDEDLSARAPSPGLRAAMALEASRSRSLFAEGAPLVRRLPLRPAAAVAAFIAGGRAALRALEAAGYDVLGRRPRPSRRAVAVEFMRAWGRR